MPPVGTRALHREQVQAALDLHASGLDVRTIAGRLGLRADRAAKLLSEGIAALPAQDVDELRTTSELRLDRLAATYGELLDDPDPKVRLAAAGGLRQVESDRARLLGTWQRPPTDKD